MKFLEDPERPVDCAGPVRRNFRVVRLSPQPVMICRALRHAP